VGGYGESKLAIMLFTNELARRGVRAYAADPGGADTNIVRYSTGYLGWSSRQNWLRNFPQSAQTAARSSILAVTTDLPSGTYFAPRFMQFGKPRVTKVRRRARDPVTARRLWELSAELTGCDWQGPALRHC
jgi:NAD(P)-dependent dehydrogenase (short-subunit alcohol dehydrogenase family)